MAPLLIRQISQSSGDPTEWAAADEEAFVARILERAQERRMQAPFLVAAELSDDVAQLIGIPSLAGVSGAMVLHDDGVTRFVAAAAGALITSGSGRVDEDNLTRRVEICRAWLSRVEGCDVEVTNYEAPTDAAIRTWAEAEDAQAAALAAYAAERTPSNLERLAAATNARHRAYAALPPFANTSPRPEGL